MANFLTEALKLIGNELPKFFTETGTPFLGKDVKGSVMTGDDPIQKEKDVNEALLKLGAAAIPLFKGAQAAAAVPHIGKILTGATAAATQDPTVLIPGRLGAVAGLATASDDANAMIVPANKVKSFEQLQRAATALAKGMDPEIAYKATGVYRGPKDDILRSVISDEGVKFKEPKDTYIDQVKTLGELIEHPKLFAAMPELKDIKIGKIPQARLDSAAKRGGTLLGGYEAGKNELTLNFKRPVEEMISTILHETQHAVQAKSGMVLGSNVARERRNAETAALFNSHANKMDPNLPDHYFDELLNKVSRQVYFRGAGEAEARATQRMYELGKYTDYPLKQNPDAIDNIYDVDINSLLFPVK